MTTGVRNRTEERCLAVNMDKQIVQRVRWYRHKTKVPTIIINVPEMQGKRKKRVQREIFLPTPSRAERKL